MARLCPLKAQVHVAHSAIREVNNLCARFAVLIRPHTQHIVCRLLNIRPATVIYNLIVVVTLYDVVKAEATDAFYWAVFWVNALHILTVLQNNSIELSVTSLCHTIQVWVLWQWLTLVRLALCHRVKMLCQWPADKRITLVLCGELVQQPRKLTGGGILFASKVICKWEVFFSEGN